jgi:hypothetical protein
MRKYIEVYIAWSLAANCVLFFVNMVNNLAVDNMLASAMISTVAAALAYILCAVDPARLFVDDFGRTPDKKQRLQFALGAMLVHFAWTVARNLLSAFQLFVASPFSVPLDVTKIIPLELELMLGMTGIIILVESVVIFIAVYFLFGDCAARRLRKQGKARRVSGQGN